MTEPSKIDQLATEFNVWATANNLVGEGDVMELLMLDVTREQRTWLSAFLLRWEAAEAADEAFYDKQTVTGV